MKGGSMISYKKGAHNLSCAQKIKWHWLMICESSLFRPPGPADLAVISTIQKPKIEIDPALTGGYSRSC